MYKRQLIKTFLLLAVLLLVNRVFTESLVRLHFGVVLGGGPLCFVGVLGVAHVADR